MPWDPYTNTYRTSDEMAEENLGCILFFLWLFCLMIGGVANAFEGTGAGAAVFAGTGLLWWLGGHRVGAVILFVAAGLVLFVLPPPGA